MPICAEALGVLPDAERFATLSRAYGVVTGAWGEPSGQAMEIRCMAGALHHGSPRNGIPPCPPPAPATFTWIFRDSVGERH